MPKRGRLGNDEMEYIRLHAHSKPPAEIGAAIDRSEEVVLKYIRDHVPPAKSLTQADAERAQKIAARQEMRNSEAWKNLKGEFFEEELLFFEECYLKMMDQLGDVFATEQMQVLHAVKYEVLMSRNLKSRKKYLSDIANLEQMQEEFLRPFKGRPSAMSEKDRAFAMDLETQVNSARANEKSLTTEFAKLQEQHSGLMKALKSTRDQRIKQIDTENKDGFLSVVKMLERRDEQERQGRQIELVKLAGRAAYVNLGRPTKFDDGNEDSPILSADTVDLGPEDVQSSDKDSED